MTATSAPPAPSANMPTLKLPHTRNASPALSIGQIGFGTMSLTWRGKPLPHDEAIPVLKEAIDRGCTLLNCGAFYGPPSDAWANLKLIRAFTDAHPEYVSRFVLSLKGGMDTGAYEAKGMAGLKATPTVEELRRDLGKAKEILGTDRGGKRIDLFEVARVQREIPIEEQMRNLAKVRDEGYFDHITVSEIGASALRRAAKVADIVAVEIELSPFEQDAKRNGVLQACDELGIVVFAYSPVGRGLLTGHVSSKSDLPEGDPRSHLDRFSDDHLDANLAMARRFVELADKKRCTPAQLALAWCVAQSPEDRRLVVPIPGTTKVERVRENAAAANVQLTAEELASIDAIAPKGFSGERYSAPARAHGNLFGDTV